MSARKIRRNGAVVIGSGELASAIARALHRSGLATVMCDEVDPGCMRRGMAFADAWYVGDAALDETTAVFCASARSIPALLGARDLIAATAWSCLGVLQAISASVLVDARTLTTTSVTPALIERAPRNVLTIGATPWHVSGRHVHAIAAPADVPRVMLSAGTSRVWDPMLQDKNRKAVAAPMAGRFATDRRIGEHVLAGEPIGAIGGMLLYAPATGVLSGLAARGARTFAGFPVIEVDTRGQPAHCFTIPTWCLEVAADVVRIAMEHREAQAA